jgi:putative lipoprotein
MKNSIKFRLCSLAAALLLCGCGDDGDSSSAAANSAGQNSVSQGSAGQNSADQNSASSNSASQSAEQNHTAKPRISVKSGEAPKKDDKFVSYDFYGERKVNFNLNGDVNETTKNIVAYSSIKNQYEKLNFDLMKKRLGHDFILRCSACHDDYANGIIGPSLLDKTDAQIVDMIKKYKFKEKPNPLMVQLVNGMSEQQIETMAKEIYEFNQQFKEQK